MNYTKQLSDRFYLSGKHLQANMLLRFSHGDYSGIPSGGGGISYEDRLPRESRGFFSTMLLSVKYLFIMVFIGCIALLLIMLYFSGPEVLLKLFF